MKIMVAYEKPKGSEKLLQVALQQAKALDAKVHLVTSLIVSTLDEEKLQEEALTELKNVKAAFEKEGISCETKVFIRGRSEGDDLIGFAEDNQIDEIIIGAKKRSKVGKLLLGSVTQYVILEAQCPVLTVKVE